MTGRVILAGAPLGNPGDASARLREVLASADVVAAEDTRRLARLARDLDVTVAGRVVSYFEGNEERRTPDLVDALRGGAVVAVILFFTLCGLSTVSFLIGAVLSGAAGFAGMNISVRANVRTAEAARTSLQGGLTLAFRSGDVPHWAFDVSGFLVPPVERRAIKASTFSFAKWDWVR